MPLAEMEFKGRRVFVEVDEAGGIVLDGGRARMRYGRDDERVYSPWPGNLRRPGETAAPPAASPPPVSSPKPAAKAKARPRKPAAAPASVEHPAGRVIAYTDGACLGNPGPAGLGYAVLWPDGARVERGEPLGHGTNNIAELTAILRVLELLADQRDRPVVIHSDSEYAIGVLTRDWKAKANQELIARIRAALRRFPACELRKVPAHSGVPDNELVDGLARRAAETQTEA
jgi:ribonuclease HI